MGVRKIRAKFIVSHGGKAYDARAKSLNRKFYNLSYKSAGLGVPLASGAKAHVQRRLNARAEARTYKSKPTHYLGTTDIDSRHPL
jgi:hypothetical protein